MQFEHETHVIEQTRARNGHRYLEVEKERIKLVITVSKKGTLRALWNFYFIKTTVVCFDDLARFISPDQDYGRPLNERYKRKL